MPFHPFPASLCSVLASLAVRPGSGPSLAAAQRTRVSSQPAQIMQMRPAAPPLLPRRSAGLGELAGRGAAGAHPFGGTPAADRASAVYTGPYSNERAFFACSRPRSRLISHGGSAAPAGVGGGASTGDVRRARRRCPRGRRARANFLENAPRERRSARRPRRQDGARRAAGSPRR